MKKTLILSVLLVLTAFHALAQSPPSVLSPEIHPDRKITFRFPAPSALKVILDSELSSVPAAMTKDESGIWSITLGPARADLYAYTFVVDGISVCDPNNTLITPGTI